MSYAVIACETLRDELDKVMQQTGCQYPVIWVDSKYHIDPNELRTKLQQEIDNLSSVENILFAYGCCGNGLVGLHATSANLIIPKTDDCISMVLTQPGEKFQRQKHTYFLTKGWMQSSKSLTNEYRHILNRYGEKRTKRIFDSMLKNYQYLMLIDTGAYEVKDCLQEAEELAQNVNLEVILQKGGLWLLKQLVTGPYDENFCVIPKGEQVNITHFGYAHGTALHHQVV